MDVSDDALIERILGGETQLFGQIVERYRNQIFNLMYRYCQSSDEAAEMTQEVFCRSYEKLNRYRPKESYFAWLYTMGINYANDWSRKRTSEFKKRGALKHEQEVAFGQKPESSYEAKEQQGLLESALAGLPVDRREMIILRYRHDCSIRDLASIFSLKESAVKMRIKRTLEELNTRMSSAEKN